MDKYTYCRFIPGDLTGEGGSKSASDGKYRDFYNVYMATTQEIGIQVFNAEGNHLENIPAPTITNNVSFGGEENKTILIAAEDGIYGIQGQLRDINLD